MDWYDIAGKVIIGVAASLGVLGVQWLIRRCTRPALHVDFVRALWGCAMPTSELLPRPNVVETLHPEASAMTYSPTRVERHAMYFSVKVTNAKGRRTAKNCRGFLAGIDFKDERGTWQPTEFCDNMPLAWSYRSDEDANHGIDVPAEVSQFLNVFSQSDTESMFRARTAPQTLRQSAFERFSHPGDFRIRIFVTADEAKMNAFCLKLHWKGHFDENVFVCQDTSWP